MKKTILIASLLLVGTSLNVLGDGHLAEEQSKGAFSGVMVAAKDTDKYLKSNASNPALFELVGADAAGYCRTVSGHDYPGQVMVWTAFPNVLSNLVYPSNSDAEADRHIRDRLSTEGLDPKHVKRSPSGPFPSKYLVTA